MINIYETVKLKPLTETVHIKDISDEVYFSKEYGDYISNSRLKLINPDEGGSPSKFLAGLNNNKIYSDALIFGSAVHELTLQPSEFVLTEIDRPTAKAGFMADYIWDNYLVLKKNANIIGLTERCLKKTILGQLQYIFHLK